MARWPARWRSAAYRSAQSSHARRRHRSSIRGFRCPPTRSPPRLRAPPHSKRQVQSCRVKMNFDQIQLAPAVDAYCHTCWLSIAFCLRSNYEPAAVPVEQRQCIFNFKSCSLKEADVVVVKAAIDGLIKGRHSTGIHGVNQLRERQLPLQPRREHRRGVASGGCQSWTKDPGVLYGMQWRRRGWWRPWWWRRR